MKKERHGVRLLVVDDDATNQEVAVRILEHLGYEAVTVAGDGKQALAALSVNDFDLVLMDCHLPDVDGYETARLIRNRNTAVRNHDIPIVATTAAAMEEDRRKCFAAGMNGYIAKPLRFAVLEEAIEQWTGGVRTADAPPATAPVTPLAANRAAFDRKEFDECVMGNEVLARRIIRTFVNDMPRQIALLAQAVNDGDVNRVRMVAHSIKGAAASVSGQEMRDSSWKLEQQGRAEDLTGSAAALVELSASFARARPVMESFCQEDQTLA
jgi:CheY-like chemotaxis protein/HPt (histidine-containing phosphotransfer) domain-containing protein